MEIKIEALYNKLICMILVIGLVICAHVTSYAASSKGTVTDSSVKEDVKEFVEEIDSTYEDGLRKFSEDLNMFTSKSYAEQQVKSELKSRYEVKAMQKVKYVYQLAFDGYITSSTRNSCVIILRTLEKSYGFDLGVSDTASEFREREKLRQEQIKVKEEQIREIRYLKGKDRLMNLGVSVLLSWRERGWSYNQEVTHSYDPGLDIRMCVDDITSYHIRPDCSGFIGTVLREYGVSLFQTDAFKDVNTGTNGIDAIGTTFMVEHIEDMKNDPKLEILDFDINNLQAGDIMLRMPGQNGYKTGHTEIYIGPVNLNKALEVGDEIQVVNWGSNKALYSYFPIEVRNEHSIHNTLLTIDEEVVDEDTGHRTGNHTQKKYVQVANTNPYAIALQINNFKLETRNIAANQYVYIVRVHDEQVYDSDSEFSAKWIKR